MCSITVAKRINGGRLEKSHVCFFQPLPPGYLLAKTEEPVSPSSEDEDVTKPVQEAGNFAKIEIDP